MSGIINKVKAAVSSDQTTTGHTTTGAHTTGTAEGVHGPHASRAGNAADPRIDSDRDGSHHVGGTHTGTGIGGTHAGTGVGHSTHNTGVGSGITGNTHSALNSSTNHGPHDSNMANKADPRIDSDRDGRAAHSGIGGTHTGAHTGTGGTHTGTTHSTTTTAGPHSSNVLNKADPRVDSDRSNTVGTHGTHHNTRATGTGVTGNTHNTGSALTGSTGTHGGISSSTNAGPHNSNLANKADPRVDSDLDSTGNRHTHGSGGITGHSGSHATPGSGTAQNTAGPHNSDLLNKIDPRVDSDLSGGKTFGGNKTHA